MAMGHGEREQRLTPSGAVWWLLAAIALVGVMLVGVPPQAAESAPAQARVNWQPCGDGFECATVPVPLDYSRQVGGAIQVRLIRLPASGGPDERIGSLFTNPGGPGGSGVAFLRQSTAAFPEAVRERYDLVGFDPRGIARSTGLRCFGSQHQVANVLAPFAFPFTVDQIAAQEEQLAAIAASCERRGGRILDHMSTANVARDLDLLRQAVGDEKLHYIGFSYGSQLGNTYINLFPDKVGRVVLDGIVDPVAWTVGREGQAGVPTFIRIGSAAGAAETLGEFHRLCDEAGPQACLLAPVSEQRLEALLDELRGLAEPVIGIDPFTGEQIPFTYDLAVGLVQVALDNPVLWPTVAALLAGLEAAVAVPGIDVSEELGARYAQAEQILEDRRWLPNYPGRADIEWQMGVTCSDSTNQPAAFRDWQAAVQAAVDQYGFVAEPWAWASSQCPTWPGEDTNRYEGPDDKWGADTDNTVLVVSSRYDASTPYQAAQRVDGLLGNSQLVTFEGWGHVAFLQDACTVEVVSDYLLTGDAPAEDPKCPAPPSPFLAQAPAS